MVDGHPEAAPLESLAQPSPQVVAKPIGEEETNILSGERGVGLVVIDLETSRTARLHDRLVELTEARPGEAPRLPAGADIWAAAYRPLRRDERAEAEIWLNGLALGDPLPEPPLWIDAATAIPVDLETSYLDTCRRNRIDVVSASEGPEIGST